MTTEKNTRHDGYLPAPLQPAPDEWRVRCTFRREGQEPTTTTIIRGIRTEDIALGHFGEMSRRARTVVGSAAGFAVGIPAPVVDAGVYLEAVYQPGNVTIRRRSFGATRTVTP